MSLLTDRPAWRWIALILIAGSLIATRNLLGGDPEVAAFVLLAACSGALTIAIRGCTPDERIRLAEMRAAERAMTITLLSGSTIAAAVLLDGGDPTPWLAMTAIAIAAHTATSVVAIVRS